MRVMPLGEVEDSIKGNLNNTRVVSDPMSLGSAGELGMLLGFLLVNGGCIAFFVLLALCAMGSCFARRYRRANFLTVNRKISGVNKRVVEV
uniref:Uncharacterized protein n=1 Tax=Plectus sambesii TaxID=2011161 RepID=A0A914URJ4_9BILA